MCAQLKGMVLAPNAAVQSLHSNLAASTAALPSSPAMHTERLLEACNDRLSQGISADLRQQLMERAAGVPGIQGANTAEQQPSTVPKTKLTFTVGERVHACLHVLALSKYKSLVLAICVQTTSPG